MPDVAVLEVGPAPSPAAAAFGAATVAPVSPSAAAADPPVPAVDLKPFLQPRLTNPGAKLRTWSFAAVAKSLHIDNAGV